MNLLLVATCAGLVFGNREDVNEPVYEEEPVEVASIDTVPDFSRFIDIESKKKEFFDFMRPVVEAENARVREQRERFLKLYGKHEKGGELDEEEREYIQKLIKEYRANRFSSKDVDIWEVLKRRVDVVPVPLALVQAANESAWGTSRFAREGNNLFGQWCFGQACGIVPKNRVEGENYAVARYETVNRSVRSYIRNINTSYAYGKFRDLRLKQRENGEELDSYLLVEGLLRYSTRREDYLEEIRAMLRVNVALFEYDIGDSSLYAEAKVRERNTLEPAVAAAKAAETAAVKDMQSKSRISQ